MATKIFCDSCGKFLNGKISYKASFWRMFTKDDTYGAPPQNIDLCSECYEKIISLARIGAEGATIEENKDE